MKDQHTKISGYRDFYQDTVDLINEIKDLETQVANMWKKVYRQCEDTWNTNTPYDHHVMAEEDLKKGFMHLVRSVSAPVDPWEVYSTEGEVYNQNTP